jgi:fibronectin type 3 domain-containing protein
MYKTIFTAILALVVFVIVQPVADAYPGGMLGGKTLMIGKSYTDAAASASTTLCTDGSETTYSGCRLLGSGGADTMFYHFTGPVNLNGYQIKTVQTDATLRVSVVDSSGNQTIISSKANISGVKQSFTLIKNVRYIVVENTGSNLVDIAEIDVFGFEPDNIPPVAVTGLYAVNEIGKVTLYWNPNTQDSDLQGYLVYRDGVRLTPTPIFTTSYVVSSGMTNGTSYTFAVVSIDHSDNESTQTTVIGQPLAPPDKTPPQVPTNLIGTASNYDTVALSWDSNTTDADFAGFYVYKNGVALNTTPITATSYTVPGLDRSRQNDFNVASVDKSGNISSYSNTYSLLPDTTPPSVPVLKGTPGILSANLSWDKNTTDADLAGYLLYQDGSLVTATPLPTTTTNYSVTGLTVKEYTFELAAIDNLGNVSKKSNTVKITPIKPNDVPTNVSATGGKLVIRITWDVVLNATQYRVYRDGVLIGTTTTTVFDDTNVKSGQTYRYEISALISGVEHAKSSPPAKATPNNAITFPPIGGGGGGGGSSILTQLMDMVQTAVNFLSKFSPYIIAVLGIIFAPTILSFPVWLFNKMKGKDQKQEKGKRQRQPLSPEEKERRAKERKLNQVRDEKYDNLTRMGRIRERDEWVKQSGYLNKEQRQQKAREERNRKAREQRAAASAGRKQRTGRTGRTGRTTTRKGRAPRNGR